jgi:hypothetical protein
MQETESPGPARTSREVPPSAALVAVVPGNREASPVGAATVLSGIAIVVALSTFALTYRASIEADRRGRMPVLVVLPNIKGPGWLVENIGNGAALNIVIAQGRGSKANGGLIELRGDSARRHHGVAPGESWCNPIHLRPMSAGGSQKVDWPFETSGVGITYTDALGFAYTVRTSEEGSRLTEQRCVPEWSAEDLAQLSEVEGSRPHQLPAQDAQPWGRRP